jgi:putative flippase GtrA
MPDTARKLVRYLFTGGTAAIVDIGGFGLLSFLQTPIIVAAACSFCMAMVVNFLLTSRWVFRAAATGQAFAFFLMGALFGLLVNVALTSVGVIYLDLPRIFAKTIAVGATFLLNFWINTRIFRDESNCSPATSQGAN